MPVIQEMSTKFNLKTRVWRAGSLRRLSITESNAATFPANFLAPHRVNILKAHIYRLNFLSFVKNSHGKIPNSARNS